MAEAAESDLQLHTKEIIVREARCHSGWTIKFTGGRSSGEEFLQS